MLFSYDSFGKAERPVTYLANPNKKILGTLDINDFATEPCFSNISEVSFKIYKYKDNNKVRNYDDVEQLRLVLFQTVGWFVIDTVKTIGDATNEYKQVSCKSLEYELTTKTLTSFGSLGTDTDEQGGLDRYALYDTSDTSHSILHIVMQKAPNWTVGTIDSDISTGRRSFNNDSIDAYSFLTNDVATEYECVFVFDTFERKISAYKLENIGKKTSIYLSYDNIIQEVEINVNASDIKTVMTVSGGDDNGTSMQITDVNPSGTSSISDFTYYKAWMSDALRTKLEEYETTYDSRQTQYNTAITTLNTLYTQLSDLNNRLPDTPHSTNWSLYGVDGLQDEFDYYNTAYATAMQGNDAVNMGVYWNLLYGTSGVNNALTTRKAEYKAKEVQIEAQEALISSLTLNLRDYLGSELFKELSSYEHDVDYVNDSFVVYDTMTQEEVLQMKLDLLSLAINELAKACKPSYTMTIKAKNFVNIPEFKRFADQLELGCIITVVFNDIPVESRLLKMHYNWDKEDDFELTFSSKSTLEEGRYALKELGYIANATSTTQTINKSGWNGSKTKANEASNILNTALDASRQKVINSSNETFVFDATGTKWRKWNDGLGDFYPQQMWGTGNGLYLTNDNWNTVSVAIGEIKLDDNTFKYGIAAEVLLGKFIIGQNLYMQNSNNTMTFNENGLSITNGMNTIAMNPNVPNLFTISKGATQQMYMDTDGNVCYAGLIKGGSIDIGDGTFKVTNLGVMTATSGTFGGSLNGASGTFSGTVQAGMIKSGTIEGTTIYSDSIKIRNTLQIYSSSEEINGVPSAFYDCMSLSVDAFSGYSEYTLNIGVGTTYTYVQNLKLASNANNNPTINNIPIACTQWVLDNFTKIGVAMTSLEPSTTGGNAVTNVSFSGGVLRYAKGETFVVATPSDERLKDCFMEIDNAKKMYLSFNPFSYKFKTSDTNNKIHFGLKAQDVIESLKSNGMDYKDYDIIEEYDCREFSDESSFVDNGKAFRLHYNNLHAYHIAFGQEMYKELMNLREEVENLKNQLRNTSL